MDLSVRLSEIASMVTPGGVVADVGTDHGYLSIYLAQTGQAVHVIAMDVAKGPLSTAVSNIRKAGLCEKIETRLSDGLEKLKYNEADTVVMAGMGGNLMIRLLSDGRKVLESVKELILSPQSEIELVRIFLMENSYIIEEEKMLTEDSKTYVIMRVCHGSMDYTRRCELKYGRKLLESRNPVLYENMLKEKEILLNIRKSLEGKNTESVRVRLTELDNDLECINEGMEYYEV